MRSRVLSFVLLGLVALTSVGCKENGPVADAVHYKDTMQEAYVYGFPMLMNYGAMYEFFVDKASSQYKGPFNTVLSEHRVFTPKDTAIVTPNSDTPYSGLGLDLLHASRRSVTLRAETGSFANVPCRDRPAGSFQQTATTSKPVVARHEIQ